MADNEIPRSGHPHLAFEKPGTSASQLENHIFCVPITIPRDAGTHQSYRATSPRHHPAMCVLISIHVGILDIYEGASTQPQHISFFLLLTTLPTAINHLLPPTRKTRTPLAAPPLLTDTTHHHSALPLEQRQQISQSHPIATPSVSRDLSKVLDTSDTIPLFLGARNHVKSPLTMCWTTTTKYMCGHQIGPTPFSCLSDDCRTTNPYLFELEEICQMCKSRKETRAIAEKSRKADGAAGEGSNSDAGKAGGKA